MIPPGGLSLTGGIIRALRFSTGVSRPFVARLYEAIAVAIHLEDVDVVGDAAQQSAGQALGSQGLRPFVERKVAGDQGGTPVRRRMLDWLDGDRNVSAP